MPFGIQPIHIVIVVVAALLIFGPAKLPEIGRSIGRGLNEFRRGAKEMSENFMEEVNQSDQQPASATASPENVQAPASPPAPPEAVQASASSPAQPAAQVVCPTCGNANPAQARFCNGCGAALQ